MFRPPTKYSEYLQDVRKSIDYILSRVNSTTVGTLQQVTNAGSTTTNAITTGGITTDYVQLNTLATPTLAPGMFAWNDAFGTADLRLKGGNVTLQLGQETLARVVNKTGADLLESQYRVVRVRIASEGGSQGQRLAVVLAQGNNDPDSVTTLGIVTETILNNQEGFITVFGNVNNIDTTGSLQGETWLDGDVLYLSPTIPGALTKVKPIAPNHSVTMGYVIYAHGVNGKIFVKVDNGYELDELHNVRITAVANNDLLQYDSVQQVWKNVAASVAVPTPTLAQVTTAGNTTTNAITVGGLTVATNLIYTDTVNGRVGIGTISPIEKVDITTSADNQFALVLKSVSGRLNLKPYLNSTYGVLIESTNLAKTAYNPLTLSGSKILMLDGNVIIGATSDSGYKLDVNGTARVKTTDTSTPLLVNHSGSVGIQIEANSNGYRLRLSSTSTNADISTPDGYIAINSNAKKTIIGASTSPSAILQTGGSITAASAIARGVYFNNTLVAAANNDVLVGLDINPTFTNGAFTGVTNYAIRTIGDVRFQLAGYPSYGLNITNALTGETYISKTGASNLIIEGARGINISPTNNVGVGILGSSLAQTKLSVFTSIGTNPPALGSWGGTFSVVVGGNNGYFGLLAGVVQTSGDAWFQAQRVDATATAYNILLQPTGGNVLVGTSTNAGYKLDVVGAGRFTGNLTVSTGGVGTNTFNANVNYLFANQNNVYGLVDLQNAAGQSVFFKVTGTPTTGTIFDYFWISGTTTSSTVGTTRNIFNVSPTYNLTGAFTGTMRGFYYNPTLTSMTGATHRAIETTSGDVIFNGGNVGIGTTTPTDIFHIVNNTNGNKFARISAGAADASAAWVAQNDQVDNIVYRVFGSGVAGFQMGIALARSASLIANLDGTGKFLIGTYSNTDIIFGTGDQSRIRVSGSNGNVMIGTLTDIGTKLNVSGEINSAGYRVNNVFGWSGTINIPTTPPISITVDGGIITNVV